MNAMSLILSPCYLVSTGRILIHKKRQKKVETDGWTTWPHRNIDWWCWENSKVPLWMGRHLLLPHPHHHRHPLVYLVEGSKLPTFLLHHDWALKKKKHFVDIKKEILGRSRKRDGFRPLLQVSRLKLELVVFFFFILTKLFEWKLVAWIFQEQDKHNR